ncbi:sigma-54-dependent Fis family transcriptional regulator [Mucilaginibacter sp. L196]|uniref:sigma-54 interaction domain-containing protein n=1 Tax=Mucilaginibacter sp. L196 TaxID=1641870 RepID=UPI00131BF96E|nr:sigma-54 dependent transcriptional regulator [Mucilaginibacter sp. L196]
MSNVVITLPQNSISPLSIRAKVLVFEDKKSEELLKHIGLIAPSNANVLVMGETGTGKELIAREIHKQSLRAGSPFVAINCGAFSETLIESELFGHEKGAFTGAVSSKEGWFEAANGGTLFLDEIGDLPLQLQVKMLRVLQEGQVVKLGSRQLKDIDVRIIAATNINLEDSVAAGRFREDLYYRLNVVSLYLPPLKERPGDILPLAKYFIQTYSKRLGLSDIELSAAAVKLLVEGYPWPGNIRELENVIHHALLVCRSKIIQPEDLNLRKSKPISFQAREAADKTAQEKFRDALLAMFESEDENLYENIERQVMKTAFDFCHHNQLETARLLGISRNIVRAILIKNGDLHPKVREKEKQ